MQSHYSILLQIGSARGPKTGDLVSTLIILAIALLAVTIIYILKPKLRPWVKPLIFTCIMAVLIFLYTFMVVRKKEIDNVDLKTVDYELPNK